MKNQADELSAIRRDLNNRPDTDTFKAVGDSEVSDGRVFGMTSGELAMASILLFVVTTVVGVSLLFLSGTITLR